MLEVGILRSESVVVVIIKASFVYIDAISIAVIRLESVFRGWTHKNRDYFSDEAVSILDEVLHDAVVQTAAGADE